MGLGLSNAVSSVFFGQIERISKNFEFKEPSSKTALKGGWVNTFHNKNGFSSPIDLILFLNESPDMGEHFRYPGHPERRPSSDSTMG